MKYSNVLIDLDGTIIDSQEGLFEAVKYSFTHSGLAIPTKEQLRSCIGPPLHHSLSILAPHFNEEQIKGLIELFRKYYSEKGVIECKLYPGIKELLEFLSGEYKLFLATSKPHIFARQILEHHKVDHLFDGIYGSELDGTRSDKFELINYIIDQEKIKPTKSLMIGDRKYDILGAKKAKIDSVGVNWGYAPENEFKEFPPTYSVDHATEIQGIMG